MICTIQHLTYLFGITIENEGYGRTEWFSVVVLRTALTEGRSEGRAW